MNGTNLGLAAHLRRESEEKRHQARQAVDDGKFNLAADLRAEADALLARADETATVRPLQPASVAVA